MKKLLMIALVAVGLSACGNVPAPFDGAMPEPEPTATVWIEACLHDERIAVDSHVDCDLVPPQTLTLVYDESWSGAGEAWGGDAALAAADEDCRDHGGTPEWHDGASMDCVDVDY